MIRTTMDRQEGGKYVAQLFDDQTLIVETTEALPFSQAVRWIGRASADYVLAQAAVGIHQDGLI